MRHAIEPGRDRGDQGSEAIGTSLEIRADLGVGQGLHVLRRVKTPFRIARQIGKIDANDQDFLGPNGARQANRQQVGDFLPVRERSLLRPRGGRGSRRQQQIVERHVPVQGEAMQGDIVLGRKAQATAINEGAKGLSTEAHVSLERLGGGPAVSGQNANHGEITHPADGRLQLRLNLGWQPFTDTQGDRRC